MHHKREILKFQMKGNYIFYSFFLYVLREEIRERRRRIEDYECHIEFEYQSATIVGLIAKIKSNR